MTTQDTQQVNAMIVKALGQFREKHLSYRSRILVASATDKNQVAPSGTVLPIKGGTMAEGGNIATGTTTGTMFATASNQKIGFYGHAPIVRQSNTAGNVTAGGSYTSTEQAMLNDCYSVLRNLGLLS